MGNYKILTTLFLLTFLFVVDLSRGKIKSPCPDAFDYIMGADLLQGEIKVPIELIQNKTDIELKVIFSHKFKLRSSRTGYIKPHEKNSKTLFKVSKTSKVTRYMVKFPLGQYFYVKAIEINGAIVCIGSPPKTAKRNFELVYGKNYVPLKKGNNVLTDKKRQMVLNSDYFKVQRFSNSNRKRRSSGFENVSNDNSFYNKEQLRKECGLKSADLTNQWPWICSIYMKDQLFVSSGALISDIFVLTTAASVSFRNNRPTLPQELFVRLGANQNEDEKLKPVLQIIYHPAFNPLRLKLQNNIALLRVRPLDFNQLIAPVCLIRSYRNIGKETIKGEVIGWGTGPKKQMIDLPYKIDMEIVPFDECQNEHNLIPYLLTRSMFCASSDKVQNLCKEEQGKGFYVKKQNSARWTLAGVLSYYFKKSPLEEDCDIERIHIFSDLSKDVDWVERIMFADDYA